VVRSFNSLLEHLLDENFFEVPAFEVFVSEVADRIVGYDAEQSEVGVVVFFEG